MVAKPTGYVVTAAHFDVYKIGPGIIYANVLVIRRSPITMYIPASSRA